jgi:hypothetical protein
MTKPKTLLMMSSKIKTSEHATMSVKEMLHCVKIIFFK